ncbi:MAG: hypothetical protein AAGN82_05580 [Myxococcota bacterium]
MGWFERLALRLFSSRRRSLEGLTKATRVKVVGRILTPDHVPSEVTGIRAAVVTSALLRPITHRAQPLAGPVRIAPGLRRRDEFGVDVGFEPTCEVLGVVQAHGELIVGTEHGRVHIPETDLRVQYVVPLEWAPTTVQRVPTGMEEIWADTTGPVLYSERTLNRGDAVTLIATVAPFAANERGAYRTGETVDAEFQAQVTVETPILLEEELQSSAPPAS